mgnify:CR=1 FL=1
MKYSELGLCLSSSDEPAPTLPQLSRAMDEGLVRSICQLKHDPEARELMEAEVTLVVVDLWQWFGANDSSVRLAPQLVRQIINTYPHMYIDDLRIFAEKARASSFGKVYGSFSPSTMMEWHLLERPPASDGGRELRPAPITERVGQLLRQRIR